jgi:hypothetical protein
MLSTFGTGSSVVLALCLIPTKRTALPESRLVSFVDAFRRRRVSAFLNVRTEPEA